MRAVIFLLALSALGLTAQAQAPEKRVKPRSVEVSTDHLRLRYDNEVTVSPAGVFTLSVDISPRPGMHVYAPGADDYQIVSLSVAEDSGIDARPIQYPPAEIYHFEPLDERIPVYLKPFTLTLQARVNGRSDRAGNSGASVKLTGKLDYQACDDKVCFAPASVPLTWILKR
jgi:DsbC/DsbD-like thiol-disulfide interchange protein